MNPKYLSRFLALPLVMAFAVSACGDDSTAEGTTTEDGTTTDGTTTDMPTTTTPTPTGPTTTTTDPMTDSSSSTTDDTADTGSTTDVPPGEACPTYCDNAMANCTGEQALYPDMDACLAACDGMPLGSPDDTDGNTAFCRAYHAGDPAIMDPVTHCPHASASGGTVCGSVCEGYCNQINNNCTGADEAYPDDAACLATCAGFPDDGPFNAIDGNSAQCRTYHGSFPAAGDPGMHCGHASSNGDSACGDLCEGYCNQVMTNCGMLYADMTECMDECSNFPTDGAWNAVDGDSVQCRTYHASFPAAADAMLHCPHAAPDGGGGGGPCT